MVEPIHVDVACAGDKEVTAEKDTSPFGPWLLVSYGRQGNSNHIGKNGRSGPSNFGATGSMGGVGKSRGNGSGSVKNVNGVSTEVREQQRATKVNSSTINKGKVVFTEITNYTEVTNFVNQPFDPMETVEVLAQKELTPHVICMDISFELVASDLEEALAVISE
ncbi:hypothetical protein Q3G72_013781 [Acer saccharum]|nr:hypothetical protein Q3G72_013781 [Acer saccharum]